MLPHQKQLKNPAALGVLKPVSSKPPLIKQSTSLNMATTVKAAAQDTPQFNVHELQQDLHLLALSQKKQSSLAPSSPQLMLYTK